MRRPPFDDKRVRRAFASSIDKEKLAYKIYDGAWTPATGGFIPPAIPGHSPGIGLPYNPSQAQKFLAQAGYPGGQGLPDLTIGDTGSNKAHEYFKTQWLENLNVKVESEFIERRKFFSGPQNTNIFFIAWGLGIPDPDYFLRVCIRNYFPYWKNEIYDQLLEKAQQTLDQSDRIQLYQAADKSMIEEVVVIPIGYGQWHYLVKPWVKLPSGGHRPCFWPRYWKDIEIEQY